LINIAVETQLNSEQKLILKEIYAEPCSESLTLQRISDLVQAVGGRVEHHPLKGMWCFDLPQQGKDSITIVTHSYRGVAKSIAIKALRNALKGLRTT
jgi:hypothetical protein